MSRHFLFFPPTPPPYSCLPLFSTQHRQSLTHPASTLERMGKGFKKGGRGRQSAEELEEQEKHVSTRLSYNFFSSPPFSLYYYSSRETRRRKIARAPQPREGKNKRTPTLSTSPNSVSNTSSPHLCAFKCFVLHPHDQRNTSPPRMTLTVCVQTSIPPRLPLPTVLSR